MSSADTSIPLVFGDYALEDRYRLDKGRVYLTGIQALVRLPMMQRQRDLKAGLNTGGFISGYRGSPLGMYDNALWGAKRYLKENNIHFQPGLNEDLAATAVWVYPERLQILMPTEFQLPPGALGIRNPDPPLEAEKRLHGTKMAAVRAFVRANGFDRMVIDPPRPRIGIMTTGKAYLDTRQALEDLGLSEERCKTLG